MKQKLTLSVDKRKVALLRKASARKGTSNSDLVEVMAEKLDAEPVSAESNIGQFFGSLKLKEAHFEEDSRAGAELRKTETYLRSKAKRKRA